MASWGRKLAYFALGSLAVGTISGLGFAVNLGGRVSAEDEERRRKLGPANSFNLKSISGTLTYHGRQNPTIVFVHGRSASWSEALPIAERFYAEDYNVVLWERAGRTIQYGREGILDVLRVVEHVGQHPAVDRDKILLLGLSLGAAIALGAAAQDEKRQIAGVIADSPYSNLKSVALHYVTAFGCIPKLLAWPSAFVMFRVAQALHHVEFESCNPCEWAKRIQCPVLLIHGKNDWRVPSEHSVCLFNTIVSRKDLWIVEGTGHTQAFFHCPNDYLRRVNEFTAV